MSSTRETALIPELYEIILNQVDDIPTLKSCSLTCTAFRKTSQKKLLVKISFNLSLDPSSPERFYSFLHSQSGPGSDFINHFQALEINQISDRDPDTDHMYLIAILSDFNNITDFLLSNSLWSSYPLKLKRTFVSFFLSNPITHLSIYSVWEFQYTLLNCFSHLKHLTLNLMQVDTDMQDPTGCNEVPERFPEGTVVLESLAFGSRTESRQISEWMVSAGCRLDVSKLKAYFYTRRTMYTIPFESISSTLEYLILPSVRDLDQILFQTLQTIHFPNLHSIQLPIQQYIMNPEPNSDPYTLSFSLHPRNVLKTVILARQHNGVIDESDWGRAADTFKQAYIENIQGLERLIVRAPDALDSREIIERSFGWFHQRGMLRIENCNYKVSSWLQYFGRHCAKDLVLLQADSN